MKLLPHRSWPELVMHVLAHVRSSAAASLYDTAYIAYCEKFIGPASERTLGEDAVALSRLLDNHDKLASAQLLAWLFDEVGPAADVATKDLVAVSPSHVARPALLAPLAEQGDGLELLRCAAVLERANIEKLPPIAADTDAIAEALGGVIAAAPALADKAILPLRSLRLRGRVYGDEIWIGVPSEALELSYDHVAWQAAHEATVWETDSEERALVLLKSRAHEAGLGDAHARWLSHLNLD